MKKSILFLFLLFSIPSLAFASWWNPLSWFSKKPNNVPIIQVTTPKIQTDITTSVKSKNDSSVTVAKPKPVVSKNPKEKTSSVVVKPKNETPPNTPATNNQVDLPKQQNDLLQQQISNQQKIQQSLNQVVSNTTPVIQPPSAVTLTVSAPGKYGKSITINPNEQASINISVNNPNNNNLNPGFSCVKSGDWQGPVNPVDHNETSAQDNSLDFSKLVTGATKTFTVTCSNSAGSKSDSVTINIQPALVAPEKAPTDLIIKANYSSVYSTQDPNVINDNLQHSVDYIVYLVDKDKENYEAFSKITISIDAPDMDRVTTYPQNTSNSVYGITGIGFHYLPKTKGIQTIKFTAGNISASTTLEVK